MATEYSFDIVSKIDLQEVDNAVNQAVKEVGLRFDFRGSQSQIDFDRLNKKVILIADDEMKLKSLDEILRTRCAKRGISSKALQLGNEEKALGGTIRREYDLVMGIPQDKAKEIVRRVKDTKLRIQPSIRGEEIRIAGKVKDDLQAVMQMLKADDFGIPLQFTNYR